MMQQDLTRFEKMVETLKKIADSQKSRGNKPSQAMYYDLLHRMYSRVLSAKENGNHTVCYNNMQGPTELFHAMGFVPVFMEQSAAMVSLLSNGTDEALNTAKRLGYPAEVCSLTRNLLGVYLSGWIPRPDMLVWTSQPCDNNVKTGDPLMKQLDVPGFYLDAPYRIGDREIEYFSEELKNAVAFMEKVTGKKMDEERLKEVLRLQQKMNNIENEIYELCKEVPCPLTNVTYLQIVIIRRIYAGCQEAVDYLSQILSEAKELVSQGKGAFPEERFRVMTLFPPPDFTWRTINWLGKEHGVSIASDPLNFCWPDIEWDFDRPYITLARRVLLHPHSYNMCGPLSQNFVRMAVNDARERKIQGVIWWADTRCRQGCAAIRTVKDALREELDIPTCVIDLEPMDPTSISEEGLRERLESFVELMEDME